MPLCDLGYKLSHLTSYVATPECPLSDLSLHSYLVMFPLATDSYSTRSAVDGFGIGLCARYKPSEIPLGIKGSYFLLRSHWGSCFSGLHNYTPTMESEHLLWLRY